MRIKRKLKIYLLLFIVPLDVFAAAPNFCSSTEITKCFGITETQCTQAHEKAFELCLDYYAIDSKPLEEARNIMSEVVICTTKQFYLLAALNENDLNTCKVHFEINSNIENKASK